MQARLHVLMKALRISGIELAEAIHVDSSLISKWRTGSRTLPTSSPHLKNMVNYFIAKDKSLGENTILDLMLRYDSELSYDDSDTLYSNLCTWLTATEYANLGISETATGQDDGFYQAGFRVYHGNGGRRLAVLSLFDYVLCAPRGQQLLLMSQEDMSWLIEDKDFLQLWQAKLVEIIKQKHKIRIIHWIDRFGGIDRSGGNLAMVLYRWLPAYLSGGVEGWYAPESLETQMGSTLFIVEQTMAIFGMASEDPAKNRYTALMMDPGSVNQAEWVFAQKLAKCRPLVGLHAKAELIQIIRHHLGSGHLNQMTCLSLQTPLFTSMSRELLLSILQENDVGQHIIESCLASYDGLRQQIYGSVRQIISLSSLKESLLVERVLDNELSAMAGQDIFISKEAYITHLTDLTNLYLANPNWQIALSPENGLKSELPVINTWISHPSTVVAWSPGLPLLASASEPALVHAYLQYFETQWNSIPRIHRDKEWVCSEIETLLAKNPV